MTQSESRRGYITFFQLVSLLLMILALITFPHPSWSQSPAYEYKDYEVKKGGTLWDISQETLINPFLWPKVWQVNPEIKNADRIYPGQIIRIPVSLLKPELRPVPPSDDKSSLPVRTETAGHGRETLTEVTATELASPNLIAAAGFVSNQLSSVGTIVASPGDRHIFGEHDVVYTNTPGAKAGDRYSVYRMVKEVIHPVTRERVGTLYEILGSLAIEKKGEGVDIARIIQSYRAIELNSLIGPYIEQEPPLVSRKARATNINGHILLIQDLRENGGFPESVYLDKGKLNGVEVGDVFGVIRKDRTYSDQTIGEIVVVSVNETASTAVIKTSVQEVMPGDVFSPFSDR